jgi:3-oxoacyl-[acyl-carrier protein] reductase
MLLDLNLEKKVAIVTGGCRGLGKSICLNLAKEGASIVINYRKNAKAAIDLAEEIFNTYGRKAVAVEADVTVENDVKNLFEGVIEKFSSIDILVNNSGICPVSMVKDMSLEEWDRVIKTNLTGTFLTCREMVKYLIDNNKNGNIVNIASQAAFNGSKTGKSHYSASKGGVVTFTLSLAKEVSSYGIRVNAVAPGMMYTEMTADVLDKTMERYKSEIPIGRVGEVEEVARVVAFLASDVSSYMTGATVDVSGGIIGR